MTVALFLGFGFKLLHEAYNMDNTKPNEELEDAEEEISGLDMEKGGARQLSESFCFVFQLEIPLIALMRFRNHFRVPQSSRQGIPLLRERLSTPFFASDWSCGRPSLLHDLHC